MIFFSLSIKWKHCYMSYYQIYTALSYYMHITLLSVCLLEASLAGGWHRLPWSESMLYKPQQSTPFSFSVTVRLYLYYQQAMVSDEAAMRRSLAFNSFTAVNSELNLAVKYTLARKQQSLMLIDEDLLHVVFSTNDKNKTWVFGTTVTRNNLTRIINVYIQEFLN